MSFGKDLEIHPVLSQIVPEKNPKGSHLKKTDRPKKESSFPTHQTTNVAKAGDQISGESRRFIIIAGAFWFEHPHFCGISWNINVQGGKNLIFQIYTTCQRIYTCKHLAKKYLALFVFGVLMHILYHIYILYYIILYYIILYYIILYYICKPNLRYRVTYILVKLLTPKAQSQPLAFSLPSLFWMLRWCSFKWNQHVHPFKSMPWQPMTSECVVLQLCCFRQLGFVALPAGFSSSRYQFCNKC